MAGRALRKLQLVEPYICRPCLLRQLLQSRIIKSVTSSHERTLRASLHTSPARIQHRRWASRPVLSRHASSTSHASSTAINAPSTVPHELRELHQTLQQLLEDASEYIDVAQIQLALRSLESDRPVTRVAVLGLGPDGALVARKVALALLCDALAEEQKWEKELLATSHDTRSVLLRFGDEEEVTPSTSVLRTINISSPFLERNRIELLLETLSVDSETTRQMDRAQTEQAVLVPALPTPTSTDGRVVFIRYPVHKAMIVAAGVKGAIQYGHLPMGLAAGELINAALDIPSQSLAAPANADTSINIIDVDQAIDGVTALRTSSEHGAQYARQWQSSRMGSVSDWIIDGASTKSTALPASITRFLEYTIRTAAESVRQNEFGQSLGEAAPSIVSRKRADIAAAISEWSAGAHRDLQFNLDEALHSKPWKRTAWFRLLWRIDDVSASTADILHRQWLSDAEHTLAYLSGRIVESGLASPTDLKDSAATPTSVAEEVQMVEAAKEAQDERLEAATELLQMPAMVSRLQQQSDVPALFDPPWPHTIFLNRKWMLDNLVPNMHRRAQTLLLGSLSTIGGTGALAVWLWVASTGSMLYEAGAIAALGFVWALRRLQRLWSLEREQFSTTMQENGRRVLAEVETALRRITRDEQRSVLEINTGSDSSKARLAIARCQEALTRINGKSHEG